MLFTYNVVWFPWWRIYRAFNSHYVIYCTHLFWLHDVMCEQCHYVFIHLKECLLTLALKIQNAIVWSFPSRKGLDFSSENVSALSSDRTNLRHRKKLGQCLILIHEEPEKIEKCRIKFSFSAWTAKIPNVMIRFTTTSRQRFLKVHAWVDERDEMDCFQLPVALK